MRQQVGYPEFFDNPRNKTSTAERRRVHPAGMKRFFLCCSSSAVPLPSGISANYLVKRIGLWGVFILLANLAQAGSATWELNPTSGDWSTAANWTPMTVPNGPADTATFALSNTTNVSISASTEVSGITFTAAATNPYAITAKPGLTLTISGTGITNNSGIAQNFVTEGDQFGQISFIHNATAGSSTIFTNNHGPGGFFEGGHTFFFNTATAGDATFINKSGTVSGPFPGFAEFFDNSTAGNGTFTNNGSAISHEFDGGAVHFFDTSTAGSGTFINNGATASNAGGGETVFFNNSTAGNGTFINNGGTVADAGGGVTQFGVTFVAGISSAGNGTFINNGGIANGAEGGSTRFFTSSTADSATLIANGGVGGGQGGAILFEDQSSGGTSRVELFGNGKLDISFHESLPHHPPLPVTIGSVQGDGNVFLGGNNLTVGSNNLSTTYSGVIQDGGQNGGVGGSLTKIGSGTLDLTGTNTYTGRTTVGGGVLEVDGSITSNTFVHKGSSLAGTGNIYGTVSGHGTVSPGDAPGMLTVASYTQPMGSGRLLIDIAGSGFGQFSVLDVLENANVNGFLDPVLVNGFIPSIGDEFTFLEYGSLSGTFKVQNGGIFNNGMGRWVVTYQANDAVLTATKNVPDQGSTFVLLLFGLLGLVAYRQQLLREQS
jgi:autotransporter-associated beta strand protein